MKYIRIFFTFIGYLTFTALVGAAAFWYIGMKKNLAKAQGNAASTVTFREVEMHPQKDADETEALQPEPQPISRPSAIKRTHKLAAKKKTPPRTVRQPVSRPVEMSAPLSVFADERPSVSPAKVRAKKTAAATRKKTKPTPPVQSSLPPCTLTYRATDNSASPRTGRGRPNVYETTELEAQVIKRMEDLRQLKAAAEQLRNPPVPKSGIIELLTGNK